MILAWIFLCPTAIIDARAAKGVLTKGGWYKLHRNCQMLAVTLTIIGYVLITSDETVKIDEESSDTRRQHQLIGTVVTFLSIFEVCHGLLRNIISGAKKEGYDKEKHPHGPRRIIFNVLHILTGITLIFLAWSNVYRHLHRLRGRRLRRRGRLGQNAGPEGACGWDLLRADRVHPHGHPAAREEQGVRVERNDC